MCFRNYCFCTACFTPVISAVRSPAKCYPSRKFNLWLPSPRAIVAASTLLASTGDICRVLLKHHNRPFPVKLTRFDSLGLKPLRQAMAPMCSNRALDIFNVVGRADLVFSCTIFVLTIYSGGVIRKATTLTCIGDTHPTVHKDSRYR